MKKPFNIPPVITRTYQDHIAQGGEGAFMPGTDFAMPIGTPLYAIESGYAMNLVDNNRANYVQLNANSGNKWFYVHLNSFALVFDRFVNEGDLIGYSGNTGLSTGPHLHLGLYNKGYQDPWPVIKDLFIIPKKMSVTINVIPETILDQHNYVVGNVDTTNGNVAWINIVNKNLTDVNLQIKKVATGEVIQKITVKQNERCIPQLPTGLSEDIEVIADNSIFVSLRQVWNL
jgi:murein DD-endopeptidase MepM/ murein hydrolase activator NlpD